MQKPSTNHRGGKRRTKERVDAPSRRTHGSRAESTETHCKMNLKLHYFHALQEWYLSKRSDATLEHTNHCPIADAANQLNEDDLDPTQVQYLRMMYEQGVPHSSIAGVMSEVMKHKRKKGLFLAQTVKNITAKVQKAMNVVAGIDSPWSVAKKTLKVLTE